MSRTGFLRLGMVVLTGMLAAFGVATMVFGQATGPGGGSAGAPAGGAPDLSVHKSGVVSGQTITYTITVKNIGTADAPAPITVTDTLGTGASFVSANATTWPACTGAPGPGPLVCTYASAFALALGPNTILPPITVVVSVPRGGAISNCATVAAASNATPAEANTANNQVCITNTVTAPAVGPDLKITKVGVVSGQTISYTLTVENVGTSPASSPLYVTDTISPWTGAVSYIAYPSPSATAQAAAAAARMVLPNTLSAHPPTLPTWPPAERSP